MRLRPLAIALCFLLGIRPAHPGTDRPLAFTHATVIDVTGAPAQPDVTMLITGDRITAIGRSAELPPPTNAVVVDATGKFLIPGLWDMHVHWYAKDYLPLFIANGVTGVRMMWGFPEHHKWRTEFENGALPGPRLLLASMLVDGPKPFWPGSMTAANAAEGRLAVTKARQEGADFIKVYSLLPRDAYFAIADEAKKQGIPFAGHVPEAVAAEEASAAGQASVEHLTGILTACSSRKADLLKASQESLAWLLATTNEPIAMLHRVLGERRLALDTFSPAKAQELFAELRTNHTWQCPTLVVMRNVRYLEVLTNDARLKYMPRPVRAMWLPGRDFRFKDLSREEVELGKKVNEKEFEIVGGMQRAGVGLLAGTDTGNPYCFPGFGLHDELALLVQAGLSPLQALQAATLNPARFMGRERDLGTVQPGKLADLVLLDANPLDNITNAQKIHAVVCNGRLFRRAALDDMLARVEALAGSSRMPVVEPLMKTLADKDVAAAIRQYRELRAAEAQTYDFGEDQLNYVGYELLGRKRTKDAIQILQLNVEMYPRSANTYDSLAEAYMNDGNNALSITNYEKALALDPGNTGIQTKLKELRAR